MRLFLLYFFSLICLSTQAQLVLNNGVIINVNGGTSNTASSTIVLNTPPAIPIKQVGTTTSQGIMLESEWNRIQYNLSTGTTGITVPYISNATGTFVPFPLTVSAITAGVGANGSIRFSSRHAGTMSTGFDNTAYQPSKVANMNGAACAGNNSANAVDRFWVIAPTNYTTRPAVTLDFTYIMGETDINGGNTASLASLLQPQRFDTTVAAACAWNGFPTTVAEGGTNAPAGSITATSVGTLTGVQVSAAQFFPDWTLANYLVPLPVKLLNYNGICENKNVILKWISSSESNLDYYIIEKSSDGIIYSTLTSLSAAGNSSQNTSYTYIDVSPSDNNLSYYRLSETDKNGNKKTLQTIPVTGCNTLVSENGTFYSHGNEINISLFSLSNQNINVTAYDVTGRLIYQNQLFAAEGNNNFKMTPDLSQGIYLFELKTEKLSIVKRIFIEH